MERVATKVIQIVVNGQVRQVPAGQTLPEILAFLDVEPARVAVELDRTIVARSDWGRTMVGDGAALEIVQFVGGG